MNDNDLGFCAECHAVAFELSRIDDSGRGLELPPVVEVVPSMIDNADVCAECEHERLMTTDLGRLAVNLTKASREFLPSWVIAIHRMVANGRLDREPGDMTFREANLLLLKHYRARAKRGEVTT